MKLMGYKLNGYDATYKKTIFTVTERNLGVLEITDRESGTTFIVDFNAAETPAKRIRVWNDRKNKQDGKGKTVTFGEKGFYEQLKYSDKIKDID